MSSSCRSSNELELNVCESPYGIRFQHPNVHNLLGAPSKVLRTSSRQIKVNELPVKLSVWVRDFKYVREGVEDEHLSSQRHIKLRIDSVVAVE